MHFPFLVADPHSGLHYRLSDTPLAPEWATGRMIAQTPDPIWAESLANAPVETISAINAALEGLVLATSDLRVCSIDTVPDSRDPIKAEPERFGYAAKIKEESRS